MTEETFEQIRDIDHAVLTSIQDGHTTTFDVGQETTLTNRQVSYSFDKLDELGLLTVTKPDGYTDRIVDGQNRRFKAPKEAELTDLTAKYFEWTDRANDLDLFSDLTREELVQKVQKLEDRVEKVEQGFNTFRRQVLTKLEEE